jgi:hypothetical protein
MNYQRHIGQYRRVIPKSAHFTRSDVNKFLRAREYTVEIPKPSIQGP